MDPFLAKPYHHIHLYQNIVHRPYHILGNIRMYNFHHY